MPSLDGMLLVKGEVRGERPGRCHGFVAVVGGVPPGGVGGGGEARGAVVLNS